MSHTVSVDIRQMMQQLGIQPHRVTEILLKVMESSSLEQAGQPVNKTLPNSPIL
ncbi:MULTISPECIES: hypothetical protein [Paenibacillus]|uniref:hypothetical protein n=1 Tax=Paenibacillus TaxID=44249 RepID=UPI0022B8D3AA|nr:hypothetical protein [Paenibacillus caseinilyticus]